MKVWFYLFCRGENGGSERLWDLPRLQSLLAAGIKFTLLDSRAQASPTVVPSVFLTPKPSHWHRNKEPAFLMEREHIMLMLVSYALAWVSQPESFLSETRCRENGLFAGDREWGGMGTRANIKRSAVGDGSVSWDQEPKERVQKSSQRTASGARWSRLRFQFHQSLVWPWAS